MMFGWNVTPDGKKAACDTKEGFMRYEFVDAGLQLIVVQVGAGSRTATLEPADALALADAIKREYGGRDE